MVTKFVKGKYYQYLGDTRREGWNDEGAMDYVLDHKPRKCLEATGLNAVFEEGDSMWSWFDGKELWREYKSLNNKRIRELTITLKSSTRK